MRSLFRARASASLRPCLRRRSRDRRRFSLSLSLGEFVGRICKSRAKGDRLMGRWYATATVFWPPIQAPTTRPRQPENTPQLGLSYHVHQYAAIFRMVYGSAPHPSLYLYSPLYPPSVIVLLRPIYRRFLDSTRHTLDKPWTRLLTVHGSLTPHINAAAFPTIEPLRICAWGLGTRYGCKRCTELYG
jgi:hypothetical protein